jgi:alkyl hydroperoxide reductase subunit AhpF
MRARLRSYVHALTLPAEEAEDLRGLFARASEPVRHPRIELGHLARTEHEVVISEDETHPAGEDGVVDGIVKRVVVDDDQLRGVELADGRVVRRAAVFVRPQFVPNADLLVGLGCAVDDDGWAVADAAGRASVPGVWVAGNAANPRAQVITAAGEGSAAAIALNADLVEEDIQQDVQRYRLGY